MTQLTSRQAKQIAEEAYNFSAAKDADGEPLDASLQTQLGDPF
jgi:hypothetical protein